MKTSSLLTAVLLALATATAYGAERPAFETKVTNVTIFKDGHAMIMATGTADIRDGWCHSNDVPAPILGAFWSFVKGKNLEVSIVKSGINDVTIKRPCLSLDEMLRANGGRRVKLTTNSNQTITGILMEAAEHTTRTESTASTTTPASYDYRGRYIPNAVTRTSLESNKRTVSSVVMVRNKDSVSVLKRSEIKSMTILDGKPQQRITDTEKRRQISVRVTQNGKPYTGKAEVGFIYIQRGIRWIPSYRVDLLDDSKARLRLQGTIINDIVDIENADIKLVVGVPSFIMKGQVSPMALRNLQPSLSSYFNPPSRNTASGNTNYLSNAMMSQVAMPVNRSRSAASSSAGPDIPSEGGVEDLHLYKPGTTISLSKGQRAVVRLLDTTTTYSNIYKWELPPSIPQEMWRHVGSSQRQQLQKSLMTPKIVHNLRLKNSGTTPWTTGPATIFKEGTPLAQALMTYTSRKNKVDLPVTTSVDLNTDIEETETARKHNAIKINGTNYSKVSIHGRLTIKNFKSREVPIEIARSIIGKASAATKDVQVQVLDQCDSAAAFRGYRWYGWWPWWWYRINQFSKITWTSKVSGGETVVFEYDYSYYAN